VALTLDDWGLSEAEIGFFTLAAAVSTLAATPLVPSLLGRVRVRPAIAGACIAAALCFAGMHFIRSVAAWFALRMVMSVALTLVFVAAEAWILERAPPKRSGLILGVYAATLAGALALGGFVVGAVGHRGLTPLAIATFLASAAVLPLLLPGDGLTAPKGAGARPAALLTRLAAAPIIMAAPLAMGAIETGAFNLLPLYARRVGFDDSVAALTVAAMGLGNLFMQPFVGWVGDRIGARATLMLCALSGAALPLAFPMASGSAGATLALLFVYSGLVTGLYTIGLLALSRRFGGADLAAANAAFVLCLRRKPGRRAGGGRALLLRRRALRFHGCSGGDGRPLPRLRHARAPGGLTFGGRPIIFRRFQFSGPRRHGQADRHQDSPQLLRGHGLFLRHQEESAHQDREAQAQEVRSDCAQARRIRRRQDQVSTPRRFPDGPGRVHSRMLGNGSSGCRTETTSVSATIPGSRGPGEAEILVEARRRCPRLPRSDDGDVPGEGGRLIGVFHLIVTCPATIRV
jgi:predicted MFS family arabinose efflux permease